MKKYANHGLMVNTEGFGENTESPNTMSSIKVSINKLIAKGVNA